jgi:hypothetical protein
MDAHLRHTCTRLPPTPLPPKAVLSQDRDPVTKTLCNISRTLVNRHLLSLTANVPVLLLAAITMLAYAASKQRLHACTHATHTHTLLLLPLLRVQAADYSGLKQPARRKCFCLAAAAAGHCVGLLSNAFFRC